jgi:hypothetical protein
MLVFSEGIYLLIKISCNENNDINCCAFGKFSFRELLRQKNPVDLNNSPNQ